MELRIFKGKSNVNGHAGEKLLVFLRERPGAIEQLEHADDLTETIDDRHAIDIVSSVSEGSIETWIKAGIRVRVGNVDRLAGCRDGAGDALTQREDNIFT